MKCYLCQKEIKDNQKSGYHSMFAMLDKNGCQVVFHEKCMDKSMIKQQQEEIKIKTNILNLLKEKYKLNNYEN